MSLLAKLAMRLGSLNGEVAATEGLGVLLQHPAAGASFEAKVRVGAPHLPVGLAFSTQVADGDGRPDIVGQDGHREVLQVEGKFWAGLTEAQASGAYLRRMQRQHEAGGLSEHVGVLVYVVPPRRIASLVGELQSRYRLTQGRQVGGWRYWDADGGIVVGLTSWRDVVEPMTSLPDAAVSEDARQLLALVEQVDNSQFTPWTDEQRTDQETPRRILLLAHLLPAVQVAVVREGIATRGKRYTITEGGPLAYGVRMQLDEVTCTLRLSLDLWSEHGRSPVWLSFGSGAPVARRAFPNECVEYRGGVALPVPLRSGALEHEVVQDMVAWLQTASQAMTAAIAQGARPTGAPEEGELP